MLFRLVGREHREERGVDVYVAGVELVVAVAGAPGGEELVDRLRIPARLRGRIGIRHRAARAVEYERAVFLAMEVLVLQLQFRVSRITVRRPLGDAAQR